MTASQCNVSETRCADKQNISRFQNNPAQSTKETLLYGRTHNRYYYEWLESIHQFTIPKHSKVLHLGCECGDLLAAIQPSYGVGVDTDPDKVALAKRRFPSLNFSVQDPHECDIDETFDYVVIANSLGQWHDIQKVFDRVRCLTRQDSRIVITYYNYLWEGILRLGSKLGVRQALPYDNWLPTEDITNLLYLSNLEAIQTASYVMLPKPIPLLAPLCNRVLSLLPGFRCLNLITHLVARPMPVPRSEQETSVSVIVPCRNERGNIKDAVHRIPSMGSNTEIIFVDGNSTDGTVAEIKQQIKDHPERHIHLIHQGEGIGKGDAVRKGFAVATGDVLVIQDADLTAPPEDLRKFFRAWCEGKGEFINGSRLVYPQEKQAMRLLNLAANKFFGVLFTWLLGQRFRDTLCGTKMISRKCYEKIAANRKLFGDFDPFGDFDLIFGAIKQNLKVIEVPVRYRMRIYGKTNINRFRHGLLLFKMSWLAFRKIKWIRICKSDSCNSDKTTIETICSGPSEIPREHIVLTQTKTRQYSRALVHSD